MGRFGTSVGHGSLAGLHAASIADPAWFWDAVVEHLGLPFPVPYRDVLDSSAGLPWTTWFDGGRTNLAELAPLCEPHHHLVHEGGWTLTLTPDRIATWTRPDGTIYWTGPLTNQHAA